MREGSRVSWERADVVVLPRQERGLPGKLEPVSPVSPAHGEAELELLPARLSKEELIQNMDRVDREITMVEQQISKLKKKQVGACGLEGNTCPCSACCHRPCPCPCVATGGEVAVPVHQHGLCPCCDMGGGCCACSLELLVTRCFGNPARGSVHVREPKREENVSSVPWQWMCQW